MSSKYGRGIAVVLLLTAAGCTAKPEAAPRTTAAGAPAANKPIRSDKPAAAQGSTPAKTPAAPTPAVSPADRVAQLGGKIEREGANVVRIDFFGTQIGDGDLEVVTSFPDLQALVLSSTKVTDDGLEKLTGLKKLNSLNLAFTDITDKGLFTLARLPALQSVDLLQTKATSAGVAELQKARPKLNISK
jgi:hypothetical protein